MSNCIDISVIILTYFHEKYIRQAVQSVLSQDTKRTYEIIIADDCSLDKTQDIIINLENENPGRIRHFFNSENLGITKNMHQARCNAKGKYIVALSGDDYWIDSRKLEKQASILDRDSKYVGVATVIEKRYDYDIQGRRRYPSQKWRGKSFNLSDFLGGADFPTHGCMLRNFYLSDKGRRYFSHIVSFSEYIDDLSDSILTLMLGNLFIINDCTYVYRVNRVKRGNNNFNSINTTRSSFLKHAKLLNNIHKEYGQIIDLSIRYSMNYGVGLIGSLKEHYFKEYLIAYRSIPREIKEIVFPLRVLKQAFFSGIFAIGRRIDIQVSKLNPRGKCTRKNDQKERT